MSARLVCQVMPRREAVSTDSSAVRAASPGRPCGMYPIVPRRSWPRRPAKVTSPRWRRSWATQVTRVDLPAPLGPSSPTVWPVSQVASTPLRTARLP